MPRASPLSTAFGARNHEETMNKSPATPPILMMSGCGGLGPGCLSISVASLALLATNPAHNKQPAVGIAVAMPRVGPASPPGGGSRLRLSAAGLAGIPKLSLARTSRSAAPAADLRDRAALLGRLPRLGANPHSSARVAGTRALRTVQVLPNWCWPRRASALASLVTGVFLIVGAKQLNRP